MWLSSPASCLLATKYCYLEVNASNQNQIFVYYHVSTRRAEVVRPDLQVDGKP